MAKNMILGILMIVGAWVLFVVNPKKRSLRARLMSALFCSLYVAPFCVLILLLVPSNNIPIWRKVVFVGGTGPMMLLLLLGFTPMTIAFSRFVRWTLSTGDG